MYLQLHDNYTPTNNDSFGVWNQKFRFGQYDLTNPMNYQGVKPTAFGYYPSLGAGCSIPNGDVRKAFVLTSKVDWTNTAKNAKNIWASWGEVLKKKDAKGTGVAISLAALAKVASLLIKSVDFIVKTIDNAEAQRTEELAAQVYDRNEFDIKNICRQTNTQLVQNANKAFASINDWAARYEQDDLKRRDRKGASRQIMVRTRALDLFQKEIDARGIKFVPGSVEPSPGGTDLKKILPLALTAFALLR
jgi:hypothetical protein